MYAIHFRRHLCLAPSSSMVHLNFEFKRFTLFLFQRDFENYHTFFNLDVLVCDYTFNPIIWSHADATNIKIIDYANVIKINLFHAQITVEC